MRFVVIGLSPVLRILTDDPSIDGISQGEVPRNKVYLEPQIMISGTARGTPSRGFTRTIAASSSRCPAALSHPRRQHRTCAAGSPRGRYRRAAPPKMPGAFGKQRWSQSCAPAGAS